MMSPPGHGEPWYADLLPSLFMTLSLEDAVKSSVPASSEGIGALVAASHCFDRGDAAEGERILERTWQNRGEEPRVCLWAAHVLRSRGVAISGPTANEVLGVVLQVPLNGGTDTVAAYADGTFRYYNAVSGAIVVEPNSELRLNSDSKELTAMASSLQPVAAAADRMRITVLTPARLFVSTDDGVVGAAISQKALSMAMYAMSLRRK
jgi:hypothetical protein